MKIDKKLIALLATGVVAISASAETVVASTSDAEVRDDGDVANSAKQWLHAGSYYVTSPSIVTVFAFEVPTLAAGETFDTASFTLELTWVKGDPSFNCDVVGIGSRATDAILGTDYAAAGTMLHDNFFTPTNKNNRGVITSDDFADWLNVQTPGEFAIIKLDTEGYSGGSATVYEIASADDARDFTKPTLNYTVLSGEKPDPDPVTIMIDGPFSGGTEMTVSWTGVDRDVYSVETNSALTVEEDWAEFEGGITGVGLITVTNAIGPDQTFYRVKGE